MYCKACGRELSAAGARFCAGCGTQIETPEVYSVAAEAVSSGGQRDRRFIPVALALFTALVMTACLFMVAGFGDKLLNSVSRIASSGIENLSYFLENVFRPVSGILPFVNPVMAISILGLIFGALAVALKAGGGVRLLRFSFITTVASCLAAIVAMVIWSVGQTEIPSDLLVCLGTSLVLAVIGIVTLIESAGPVKYQVDRKKESFDGVMWALVFFGAIGFTSNIYQIISTRFIVHTLGNIALAARSAADSIIGIVNTPVTGVTLMLCCTACLLLRKKLKYKHTALLCAGVGFIIGIMYGVSYFIMSTAAAGDLMAEIASVFLGIQPFIVILYIALHMLIGLFTAAALCGRLRLLAVIILPAGCMAMLLALAYLVTLELDVGIAGIYISQIISFTLTAAAALIWSVKRKSGFFY